MSGWDWAVMAAYFVVVAAVGFWAGRDSQDGDDYLLGGRSIPWGAALLSLVATEISAATFLGAPEQGYLRNLTYLQMAIGSIAARFFLAHYFISVYYKAGITTVYEFLANRFGPVSQKTTAGLFLFGRLFADGARLFIAAITIEVITGLPIEVSIVALGLVTLMYTVFGGIKAVIWTDVLQAVVLVGSGLALLGFAFSDCGLSLGQVAEELNQAHKLTLFETTTDPFKDPYHALTAIVGGFCLTLATHGTDHDMVQRLLTCKNNAGSQRSTWMSGLVGLAVTVLFVTIGLLLFLVLKHSPADSPLVTQASALAEANKYGHFLLYYAVMALPQGLLGLTVAGILAAAMSTLSSAFGAMSATVISDFYRPLRPNLSPAQELRAARLATLMAGLSITAVGLLVSSLYHSNPNTDLLGLALGIMGCFYGGLLGIFLVALFTKNRGSETSNVAAALMSTSVVFYLSSQSLIAWPWYVVIGTAVSVCVSLAGTSNSSPK